MSGPFDVAPGRLRIYLGAAAGVGKTYMMLGDARLAVEDGVDLVVGYVEPHGRGPTEERARGLERAPTIAYREGSRAETEPDVEWLIQRRPSVALIDELAHTNATGAPGRSATRTSSACSTWASTSGRPSTSSTSRASASGCRP